MTLRELGAGTAGALLLATLVMAATATAHAEEARREFIARGLHLRSPEPAFGLSPETWSKSVQDLAAMLARVRHSRASSGRVVTLAEAMQLHEWRREVIRELELTVP